MTATAPELTPVQVEVIGSALESICDEMGEALVKTSYSPNIKERRDCTTGIFNAGGELLAQAEHIPMHLGSLMGIVNAITDRYALEDIHDGDSFVGNDPHIGGGTHLPDIVLVTPIFVEGALAGWATNLAHHSDYAERGHEHIFQEGLRIPPVRFLRDWTYVPEVMDLILTNMQVPAERVADFNAQVAANRLGVARFREISEKYGPATIEAAGQELLDYTERKVRAGIRDVPNGRYRFSDTFDCNELDEQLQLSVVMTVSDEQLHFEFTAPEQVRASINMVETALLATVYYAAKTVVGPDIPANGGLGRAISVSAPFGSVLNCVAPAAVNGRIQLCQRVVDLVHGALADAVPSRVIAASNGAVTGTQFSGTDPRTGRYYVYLETIGGGYGAGCAFDGLDGVQAHMTNTSNLPVEALESEYPLFVERYSLIDGSGGEGEHRGGMGIHRQVRVEHDDCQCEVGMSRMLSRPWGLLGGTAGQSARLEKNGVVVPTGDVVLLSRGDSISAITAGGGGYGDPARRPKDVVARDLREERIDAATAARVYGVTGDETAGGPA
ncbi:hydantoinase B/oxoprolinase family protein [Labedella phragmitis]|uniref:Hydantoinase B/oxoprolinase family protein n=1 Tax=Labedella phragmitis TaxID=2498849 RepID=A0A3S3ZCQ4_9MICO|nr:hydantoinase B/oxoprolinase family protein [Labedella phragmitis]RWZ52661.1 hydantoinase B/oxoprolinase family protein [Labedella phragmitis]